MWIKLLFWMHLKRFTVVLCLGENKGMLVNNECSSQRNIIGEFWYSFGTGGKKICMALDQ